MPRNASEVFTSPRKFALRVIVGLGALFYGLFLLSLTPQRQSVHQLIAFVGWLFVIVGLVSFVREWKAVSNPRLAFSYGLNPVKTVTELIDEWVPGSHRLEKDYEKALLDHLRENLRHVKITRQYGTARVKCDLAVGKDVLIELKTNLTTTNKLQRLLGQIQLYVAELDRPLVVLLLGRVDDDLFKDLQANTAGHKSVYLLPKRTELFTEEG